MSCGEHHSIFKYLDIGFRIAARHNLIAPLVDDTPLLPIVAHERNPVAEIFRMLILVRYDQPSLRIDVARLAIPLDPAHPFGIVANRIEIGCTAALTKRIDNTPSAIGMADRS